MGFVNSQKPLSSWLAGAGQRLDNIFISWLALATVTGWSTRVGVIPPLAKGEGPQARKIALFKIQSIGLRAMSTAIVETARGGFSAKPDGIQNRRIPPLRTALMERYKAVRRFSRTICETLAAEDHVIQTMPEASPTKWHLAHTSWFFETFVAKPHLPDWRPLNPQYAFLFNSYYNAAGKKCMPGHSVV